jgi:hypothetical protein
VVTISIVRKLYIYNGCKTWSFTLSEWLCLM